MDSSVPMYPFTCVASRYLATHRGAEAAAEFQRILDHRGIVLSDPIGVVARVQLGESVRRIGRGAEGHSGRTKTSSRCGRMPTVRSRY